MADRVSWKRKYAERTGLIGRLKAVPCADCGVQYPPFVMEFDHVRGEKLFTISDNRMTSMAALLAEVAKCDVVCANCHRARSYYRQTTQYHRKG